MCAADTRPSITYVIENYPSSVGVDRFPASVGGAQLQAQSVARLLSDRFAVRVLTRLPPGARREETVDGVKIQRVPLPGRGGKLGASLILAALLLRGLQARRVDLVQGFQVNATTLAAALLSLLRRAPLIIKAAHRDNFDRSGGRRRQLQLDLLIRSTSALVVPSRSLMPVARDAGVPERKLRHIPNGVDCDRFRPPSAEERSASRSRLGYADEDFVFLWIGRLDPFKRLDALIPAWPEVAARCPSARLLVVGDGAAETVAQSLVDACPHSVQRLHFHQDVRPFYHGADALLLTTRAEGLSNALLEAMACGLPAVVSAVPENLEVAENSQCLVPFRHDLAGDLQAALLTAVAGRARGAALGAKARERVEGGYSLQRTAASWAALYRELLDGDPTG